MIPLELEGNIIAMSYFISHSYCVYHIPCRCSCHSNGQEFRVLYQFCVLEWTGTVSMVANTSRHEKAVEVEVLFGCFFSWIHIYKAEGYGVGNEHR